MKKTLALFVLLIPIFCSGQNFKCFQDTVIHYFNNDIGYLRGIRLDSVRVSGTDTIYYPFKTLRSDFLFSSPDSVSGSWLGNRIIERPNGDFLVDTKWNDTILIKSQALPGESWLFYNDASSYSYRASVLSIDTMTFLGILDSVKKITITAYSGSTINTSDSINNFEFIISKNHGFVTIFDLFLFPYRAPSWPPSPYYYSDLDIYLPYTSPTINTSGFTFTLTDYHNPTKLEVYDFEVNDMFFYSISSNDYCSSSYGTNYRDSIVSKTIIDATHIQYEVARKYNSRVVPNGPGPITYNSGSYTVLFDADTSLLLNLTTMPEERTDEPIVWYYLPADTSNCVTSPFYKFEDVIIHEGCDRYKSYKVGFMEISSLLSGVSVCPFEARCAQTTTIRFSASIKSGITCGTIPPISVQDVEPDNSVTIKPNPVTNKFTLSSPSSINTVTILNMVGQTVFAANYNAQNIEIDISTLPSGLYIVHVNNFIVKKIHKQ